LGQGGQTGRQPRQVLCVSGLDTSADRPVPDAGMSWVQRLKRVFNIDIDICRECGGAVKVIAYIEDPVVIRKIRDHLKEKSEYQDGFRLPERRGQPQTRLFEEGKSVRE
ncbi:MAG: hypothetical protein WAZ48_04915, partial [Lysobacteraceae bacterium]